MKQTLTAKIKSAAQVIAEKDAEIRSMIAVHNSDVDGMRLQEENIAGQKKVIAALRQALQLHDALAELDRKSGDSDLWTPAYQDACDATTSALAMSGANP